MKQRTNKQCIIAEIIILFVGTFIIAPFLLMWDWSWNNVPDSYLSIFIALSLAGVSLFYSRSTKPLFKVIIGAIYAIWLSILLVVTVIGIPLPYKQIEHSEGNPVFTKLHKHSPWGIRAYEIIRSNEDSTYLQELKERGIPKPLSIDKTVLITAKPIKSFRIRLAYDDSECFDLVTIVDVHGKGRSGIYYYYIPDLPYDVYYLCGFFDFPLLYRILS